MHILPNISRSKGNQSIIYGLLIKYNVKNIFLQKSCRKRCWDTTRSIPVLLMLGSQRGNDIKVVKYGHKKEKNKKSSFLYNVKKTEDKKPLKFRVFCRFILLSKKILLAIKVLLEQIKISYILNVFSSSDNFCV